MRRHEEGTRERLVIQHSHDYTVTTGQGAPALILVPWFLSTADRIDVVRDRFVMAINQLGTGSDYVQLVFALDWDARHFMDQAKSEIASLLESANKISTGVRYSMPSNLQTKSVITIAANLSTSNSADLSNMRSSMAFETFLSSAMRDHGDVLDLVGLELWGEALCNMPMKHLTAEVESNWSRFCKEFAGSGRSGSREQIEALRKRVCKEIAKKRDLAAQEEFQSSKGGLKAETLA
ncbi:MAG: hypothetical protein KBC81_01420 [Candidatus Pacebacteria bacterium]|nr:hypothetical protein [Candidatus Paceibacterota bacterium]